MGPDVGLTAVDVDRLATVLGEVGQSFLDYQVVARREAEQRAEMAAVPRLVTSVPYFDDDIHSLGGLLRLGAEIWDR